MIPMGTAFYINSIKNISIDKFVCYRPLDCVGQNEMVICYNIAHQNIWKEIFNIHSINDIKNILIKNFLYYVGNNIQNYGHYYKGWIGDQLYLYEKTQKWNTKTNNLIILNNQIHVIMNNVPYIENCYYRLWLTFPKEIENIIKSNIMVDYHMPRPYEENKNVIDNIVNILN